MPEAPPSRLQSRHRTDNRDRLDDLVRVYAWLGALSATAMLYGSLVPFVFQRVPWDAVVALFLQLRLTGFHLSSDTVGNVLLSAPLAFCTAAIIGFRWPGWRGFAASALFVCLLLPAFSAAIEFLQIYVPERTSSLDDVAAQAIGGAAGTLFRWSFGSVVDEWFALVLSHTRATRSARLLALYLPGLVLINLLPFDITISPADLWHKYQAGRIVLLPFSVDGLSTLPALWKMAGVLLEAAPLGALLMLNRRTSPSAGLRALLIGCTMVAGLELAQLFIWSRYADATDLVVGWAGVALGVCLVPLVLPRAVDVNLSRSDSGINWTAATATAGWMIVLAVFEWYPFEIVRDSSAVRRNLSAFAEVPFTGFYLSDPLSALEDAVTKVLMAAPLGVFLHFMFARTRSAIGPIRRSLLSLVPSFVFFSLLEGGQAFIVGRYPSITDAILLTAAAGGGWLIAATGVDPHRRSVFGRQGLPRPQRPEG